MHRIAAAAVAFCLVAYPRMATAGPHADASLVLHITDLTGSDPCLANTILPACGSVRTDEPILGIPLFIYVMIGNADAEAGLGGASFGISYQPGANILSWTLCADTQSPYNWPASNSGLTVAWNPENCQHRTSGTGDDVIWDRGTAVIGYFYCTPYAPSNLALIPHPQSGSATINDCGAGIDDITNRFPSGLGMAGFGGPSGYSPCRLLDVFQCGISGPRETAAGTSGLQYSSSWYSMGSEWTITGNGTIVGPADGTSVIVQAGNPGTFTLFYHSWGIVESMSCSKRVTVLDAVPALPTTWSSVKALYGE
jgi:hypothetical protein